MALLVSLITGIAWPVALVWISYMFRSEIRSLFHRVSQLKFKDVEATFERGLAKAEAEISSLKSGTNISLPSPEIASKLELLRRIADVSPRAAIMEAWILVEDAAGRSGFVQGAIPRVNTGLFVEELVRLGKLPSGSEALLDQLRYLRNQAAHLPDFSLTQNEADRYLQLAVRMSQLILTADE